LPLIPSQIRFFIRLLLITPLLSIQLHAQELNHNVESGNDSIAPSVRLSMDSLNSLQDTTLKESLFSLVDSTSTDSLNADSLSNDSMAQANSHISPDAITEKVEYVAQDSIRIDMRDEKVYLYEDAQVNYTNIQLNADYILVDMPNSMVTANGVPDSSGQLAGLPIFKEGAQMYEAGKMTYNFETQKGKIQTVKTQEGDGYIQGREVKKTSDDIMYVRNGFYTTCALDSPHFKLATSKLKIIPNSKIVTGPTIMKIDNVPTPLALPFGFFPNKKGRASGVIIPTYGDSRELGFFFRDGGYYWGVNDYVDMAITGDIYTLGSWALRMRNRYKYRYHYNGNMDFSYFNRKNSFEGFPDYTETKEFFIRWNHAQDPKARPGSNFAANVNIGSRQNFQNNLNSFDQDYLTNTFQSSISYSNSFPGRPFNMTVSARHNQNTQTGAFNLNLPDFSFNVSRQYPFKNMGKIGNEWWRGAYKNFGLTYTSTATNQLTTNDTLLAINNFDMLREDFRNGARHSIPIATSFKLFKHFNMNPSVNYSEVWALKTFEQNYVDSLNQVVRDTTVGFQRAGSYNFNAALTTKVYGMFQFKGKKGVQAIRHVMTPSVSFNYQPEITTGNKSYIDGNGQKREYNIFDGTVYGSPARQESGRVGLSLLNNIEMKVRSKNDSTGVKKVTIFENLGFSTSYDLSVDSLNWAPISANARTRLGQFFTLQLSGILDPYAVDTATGIRINESNYDINGKLLRLTSANIAMNFRLQGGKKQRGGGRVQESRGDYQSNLGTVAQLEEINEHPERYIDFNVPWSLNVNYNIRYSKPNQEELITQTLNFSGDVSVTENWKIGFNSGWDMERNDFTYTSLNIHRDLHCWQLDINWIPFGPRQSYMITLNVKAPVLQDLKLNRRRDYFDVIQ